MTGAQNAQSNLYLEQNSDLEHCILRELEHHCFFYTNLNLIYFRLKINMGNQTSTPTGNASGNKGKLLYQPKL